MGSKHSSVGNAEQRAAAIRTSQIQRFLHDMEISNVNGGPKNNQEYRLFVFPDYKSLILTFDLFEF